MMPSNSARAQGCDPRQDFQYGSGCGNFTVTPFNPNPGDTVTIQVQTGCGNFQPRWLSLSNALPEVYVDGTLVTGTSGSAGYFDGWSPKPIANSGYAVSIPADGSLHTVVFTIDPNAPASCVQISDDGTEAVGPWAEFQGNSGQLWYLAKPLQIGQSYGVTYDGNGNTGGSVPLDGYTYLSGTLVTVLDNVNSLVCAGFTFDGWDTLARGTGTGFVGSDTFTIGSAPVTLYAQWTGGPPAKIGSGTYNSVALAYGGALPSGDTIKVFESNPPEALDFNSVPGKSVTLIGGYDCSFNNIVADSVAASITVSTGDVTIENIVIQ
ncbi:MAG: InlB B-repeat-containing protein [Nitrospirae bacterium]|nr:InlB B-repeat-containing protein [Nitrospirota bacterium]